MNIMSLILGVMFSMNLHNPIYLGAYLGFFIQWLLLGLLVSMILTSRMKHN